MEAAKAENKPPPGDMEAGGAPAASQHITKGRFKVKHVSLGALAIALPRISSDLFAAQIKSDENVTASSPISHPAQMIVRTSSNDGNSSAPESGTPIVLAPDEKDRDKDKAAVAPKKSRFIIKTKTPKEVFHPCN